MDESFDASAKIDALLNSDKVRADLAAPKTEPKTEED